MNYDYKMFVEFPTVRSKFLLHNHHLSLPFLSLYRPLGADLGADLQFHRSNMSELKFIMYFYFIRYIGPPNLSISIL
jgi:hypothetical protein